MIINGRILSTLSDSGVDAPTQAASSQCALGRCRVQRLYFVLPPVPTSTGSPVAFIRRYNAQRVVLTAVASFNGFLA